MSEQSIKIPLSATPQNFAYIGLLVMICSVLLLRFFSEKFDQPWLNASIIILSYALPIVFLEVFSRFRDRVSGAGLCIPVAPGSIQMTAVKLVGLYSSLGFVGALYWLFPEYHGSFYDEYFHALRIFIPLLVFMAPVYFYFLDKRMANSADGYWHLGSVFCFQMKHVNTEKIKQHLLGWLIKGFFLPLMFTYLSRDANDLLREFFLERHSFLDYYHLGINLLYLTDVAIAVAGYVFSLRIIDTHIRTCEPTIKGWAVALICYQPFYTIFGDQYVAYSEGKSWIFWLEAYPVVSVLWGTAILGLVFIYAWATLVFGLRFSNLTNRGIITAGPYKWTKHPAYLAKNISWWMISMPFLSEFGAPEAVRHSLLLGMLNYCYFLRAKTEERHLEADPIYREYAEWIRKHGLLSRAKLRLAPS